MVYIDWDKIMAVTPETFTEDDKEELVNSVVWYSPTSDIGKKQLVALIRVMQEIIKHKIDQVESLMGALDELAAKQGEEVARCRQDLLDELEELREQLEYQRRLERDNSLPDDQLRSELVRLEMQNEELVQELQERDKDLTTEKAEVERLVGEVARLEREKLDVVRELSALQDETNERVGRSVSDSPDGGPEKVEELIELVRQKNKHIMQLLDDIESVEQDNQTLKVKVANMRDQLSESSKEVGELSGKVATLQVLLEDEQKKVLEVTDKNKALTAQISEMTEKTAKHDKDLDEFAVILNSRVEEWRRLLDMKDIEIQAVREELNKYLSSSKSWNEAISDGEALPSVIKQEQEIIKLKTELAGALQDINKKNDAMEELKEKLVKLEKSNEWNLKVVTLETKISELKEQLNVAEEEATSKAKEITKLVVQLRAYEREEYGLSEAIEQVKKLEKRVLDREKSLENTIAACNHLEIEKGNLEDENLYLREKLGLSPTHVVDSSSVRRKSQVDARTVNSLQHELEKVRGEMVDLKLRNREMIAQLKVGADKANSALEEAKPDELVSAEQKKHPDFDLLEKKYIHIVEENDALRKGMHEILEGIQTQTMGDLQISSLERLLEALDARHISGWYHPAMRLQAQVNVTKGECRELRNQIRALLEEKMMLTDELEAARAVSQTIEEKFVAVQLDSPEKEASPDIGNMLGLEERLEMERRCTELEVDISQQKLAFEKEKIKWEKERQELSKEKDSVAIELASVKGRDVGTSELNPMGLKQALEFMKLREAALEGQLNVLQNNFISEQENLVKKLEAVKRGNLELLSCIHDLRSSILYLEPAQKVIDLEKQLSALRLKYNTAVSSTLWRSSTENKEVDLAETNRHWEEVEKRELLDEVRAVREKLYVTETLLSSFREGDVTPGTFNDQLSILASKLSASEVREVSERQKNVRLEKTNEILKAERENINIHLNELSEQVRIQTELSEKLHETLAEAEYKIRTNACGEPAKAATEMENKNLKLILEKKNLEELLEISRSQYRSLQARQNCEKLERNSYNECLALLQSSPGEKMAILKLNHELISAKRSNFELGAENLELKSLISGLTAENVFKEATISDTAKELQRLKANSISNVKFLFKFLDHFHSVYSSALMFPTIAKAQKLIDELENRSLLLEEQLKIIKAKEQDLAIKEDEFLIQLDALQDLKAAFHSDSKNLVNWHNKSTELRLSEARFKRRNEFLSEELARMENQAKILTDEVLQLEEKTVLRERQWAEEQKEWQQYQLQLLEQVGKDDRVTINARETYDSAEIVKLKEKMDILEEEKERLLLQINEDKAIHSVEVTKQHYRVKSLELDEAVEREGDAKSDENLEENGRDSEKVALQVTVNSLQSIIKQKEETVSRYQELLRKTREEHASAVRRLQKELKNVHNALAMQSKAYSRLKHGVYQPNAVDIEKYINKVQELEEEVAELKAKVSHMNEQLKTSQKDGARWKEVAEEKMALVEETRERMEIELERCREEMQGQEMELHNLRELTHGDHSQKLFDTIQDLQRKLTFLSNQPRPHSSRRQKGEDAVDDEFEGNEANLQRQLKSARDECARLREQLKAVRELKRRPTSAKSSQNQENLVGKIRKLEEMLQLSKQHEHELEEQGLKKIRSVEEVTRWDERKRYQKSVERLENKLKQKEVEVSVALNKLETMRGLMAKMERDKSVLEVQMRNLNESARTSSRMERLLEEKTKLAAQVATLEEEMAALQRHEGGKAAAILHAKLAGQERKIASLELANQAPVVLAAELDRLKSTNSALERTNLHLESENLNLKLSLEKLRMEIQQLNETCRRLEADKKERVQTPLGVPSRAQVRMAYDSQREVNKIKTELRAARERLSVSEERNAQLEEEVQRLLNQLSLWEEKDLADSLVRTKQQQMITDLHQQLIQVKGQLAHKVHLLDRVKVLLSKAAAKEKALNEKVAALQTMVEQSG